MGTCLCIVDDQCKRCGHYAKVAPDSLMHHIVDSKQVPRPARVLLAESSLYFLLCQRRTVSLAALLSASICNHTHITKGATNAAATCAWREEESAGNGTLE